MTNDGDRRPLDVVGALVAIGAIGGSRGQLVLRRLKWLASRTLAYCYIAVRFARNQEQERRRRVGVTGTKNRENKSMVHNQKAFIAALMATTLLTSGATWAAERQKAPPQTMASKDTASKDTALNKDFGKLSIAGSAAYADVTRARIAIFDGRTDDAKKYVNQADAAFSKVSTDEAVYTKAEADLKPPADKAVPAGKNSTAGSSSDSSATDQLKKPIAWIPVDGSITINEDYSANPAKKAAVADANRSLKSGGRKSAMEKLKLADINFDVTLAVMPLEQTANRVHQAAGLIKAGKYCEASQDLRQAQDGIRYDVVLDSLAPPSAQSNNAASSARAGSVALAAPSESDPRPIQDLTKAAQSLRDATHNMVREQASAKRGDAITQVDKTLAAVDTAMVGLPTNLLLADTNQTEPQKSAENLQNAADKLNDAVSALSSDAASGRRNGDIRTIKQALAQIHQERLNIPGTVASTTGLAK